MITALTMAAFVLALIPAVLFLRNLPLYRSLPPACGERRRCSVLIPARNEEANIADALRSVLESGGVDLEVIVLDDSSTDRTAEIVRRFAARDMRVRLEAAPPLPPGWCGKNHACARLASLARHPLLVFMDADVRVTDPDALARLAGFMDTSRAALASGVPYEETHTFMERLIIPLIHFVLLGFLPIGRMRSGTDPRFAAACGQILTVRREAYESSGGHGAVADQLHDGLALARSLRTHGFHTDLFDATGGFRCRMYQSAREVWQGFAKNAHEGLASPQLILPSTLLLLGGQVLPLALVLAAPSPLSFAALTAVLLPRLAAVHRFRQPLAGVLLHPLGICVLVAIQWFAFFRLLRKRPAVWKGRAYSTAGTA
ncbi:MAG: glycosyl transferase [Verrucomicrobiales bacterium]|nr:glycosyl transferase [Verrucomicrobiales bacterium]